MADADFGLGAAINSLVLDIRRGFSHYHALPPLKKARFRAGAAAGLITVGLWTVIGRHRLVFGNWGYLAACAGAIGFGLLWLLVGYRAARSPRDVMSAFWSIVAIGVFGFLAYVGVQLLDGTDFNFLLEGLFVGGLIGSVMRLWLAVRGMPRSGLDEVRAQQAHGRAREATEAEAAAKLNEPAAPRPQRQFQS